MSSHHIVKENQEPALALVNSKACDEAVLNAVLEWSPHVVVTGNNLDYMLSRGIKVDAVLGRKHELQSINAFDHQSHIRTSEMKVKEPVQAVINYLENNNHEAVYLFTKFDLKYSAIAHSTPLVFCIIDGNKKWSYIKSGRLRKWVAKDKTLEIAGEKDMLIKDQVKKLLNPNDLKNLKTSGTINFHSSNPFWLGEQIA